MPMLMRAAALAGLVTAAVVMPGGAQAPAAAYDISGLRFAGLHDFSDNVYTYENLARRVPIAQTFAPADSAANLRAQDRMRRLAADPRFILPGHDPDIFARFPAPGHGVAKIE